MTQYIPEEKLSSEHCLSSSPPASKNTKTFSLRVTDLSLM